MNKAKACGIIAAAVMGLILIGLALSALGVFSRWLHKPLEIVDPNNVQRTWGEVYALEEDLMRSARNVCVSQKSYDRATTENERTQRSTQVIANELAYANVASTYNAKVRNLLDAKAIKPPDVYDIAPSLGTMIAILKEAEGLDCGSY